MLNRRGFLTAARACVGGVSTLSVVAASVGGVRMLSGVASLVVADHVVLPAVHTPTPHTWDDNAITLAWHGHATVLINFYGVRILTDPVLFPRIGVNVWVTTLGPLRLTSCALAASQLPELDLVLVSHAHFDHLDTRSVGAIRGRPVAVMAPATSDLLPRRRYQSVDAAAHVLTRHAKCTCRNALTFRRSSSHAARRGTFSIADRRGRRAARPLPPASSRS